MNRFILLLILFCLQLDAGNKKILVMNRSEAVVADWAKNAPNAELVRVTPETVMDHIADADGFVGNIKPKHVRAGKNLKWVQILSAGAEKVLHLSGGTDLRDSSIVLTNNQIVQGPEIADHAMAMLLAFTRDIPSFIGDRQRGAWTRRTEKLIELHGKTAIVIGVGGIGMQIAQRAWAFGMHVIGIDPDDVPFSPFIKYVVKPDRLDEVLPEGDVVFMAAPHTPESHKMIGSKQFELMKKGSYFIAVSRGGTYDLNSLVKALDSQKLTAAGVDVTDPEPLPTGHALWQFDNVIVTPHIAGRSDQDRSRMFGMVRDNIRRFSEGKPLLNVVDKKKGY